MHGGHVLVQYLTTIFNAILATGHNIMPPSLLHGAVVIPIPKGQNKDMTI